MSRHTFIEPRQHSLRGTVTAGFFGISLAEFSHEFYQDDLFKDTGNCEESSLQLRPDFPTPH